MVLCSRQRCVVWMQKKNATSSHYQRRPLFRLWVWIFTELHSRRRSYARTTSQYRTQAQQWSDWLRENSNDFPTNEPDSKAHWIWYSRVNSTHTHSHMRAHNEQKPSNAGIVLCIKWPRDEFRCAWVFGKRVTGSPFHSLIRIRELLLITRQLLQRPMANCWRLTISID